MPLNLPIILTLFRVLLIPVFIGIFYLPYAWAPLATAFVFFLAGLTDYFDGYFARRLNQTTKFGAFLDPVADKVMVAIALTLIIEDYNSAWISIPALIMISREIIISALREWMAEIGKRGAVAVSWIGKYKTAAQMASITGLLWKPNEWIIDLSYALFYVATALTLWSMVVYIMAAWKDLTSDTSSTE